jgi:hypothetical protein
MLNIIKDQTNTLYLTLSELENQPSEYYYFLFTNRATKSTKTLFLENISTKDNFQKFEVDGSEFDGLDTGLWSYEVNASNVDEDILGEVLESGFMSLKNSTTFQPESYNEQNNTYHTYNG